MGLTIATPATDEPITLAEAKQHLRLEIDDDNAQIVSLIKAATRKFEADTGLQLITQTYLLTLDSFPGDTEAIRVPRPPLASVTSIVYQDENDVQQTLAATEYVVDTTGVVGLIALASGSTWPATFGELGDVRITFVAGYGGRSAVPDMAKAAIKLLVGHWYESREAVTMVQQNHVPLAYDSLVWSNRPGEYT